MPLRLFLAVLCLALLAGCATRNGPVPPAPVPAAEPLDPAITPLTREQEDQISR